MRIDGAGIFIFRKKKTGPATSLSPNLEQLHRHRLKPGGSRIIAHLSTPDGNQLVVPDMALENKIEILPAKNWATFAAAGTALFTSVGVGHISKAARQSVNDEIYCTQRV